MPRNHEIGLTVVTFPTYLCGASTRCLFFFLWLSFLRPSIFYLQVDLHIFCTSYWLSSIMWHAVYQIGKCVHRVHSSIDISLGQTMVEDVNCIFCGQVEKITGYKHVQKYNTTSSTKRVMKNLLTKWSNDSQKSESLLLHRVNEITNIYLQQAKYFPKPGDNVEQHDT